MMTPARAVMLAMLLALLGGASASAQPHRAPLGNAATAADEPSEDEDQAVDEDQPVDENDPAVDEVEGSEEEPPPQAARPPVRMPQRVEKHNQDRRRPPQFDLRAPDRPASPSQAMRPPSSRPQPPRPQQPAKVPPPVQSADGLPDLEDLTATRERPLFSSTRRPPEPVEEPETAPITEGASMPFELVGIVIGDDVNAAIFRNTTSKEETRVAKGDKIGRWSLEEVAEGAVVLGGGGRRVRMRLFDPASTPGIHVSHAGGDATLESETTPDENAERVDEDIAPSSSPQVKPATAQPKPPPSLRRDEQRRRRLIRSPRRANQRPGDDPPRQ